MVITLDITAENAKNLKLGMTRAQQKLIQKGDQIEIKQADNGLEINIRGKLQTQQHPSP